MKTIKETKLNTISSLTNTHMTKLLPQELSIYSKKEYQKCPHITKCSKSYGFVYLMICDTAQCKIGITQNFYFGTISEATHLVTDSTADQELLERYRAAGVSTIII